MPAIAAAVSFIDTFKMSLREMRKKFTKSEMQLVAWRSEEQYVSMVKKMATKDTKQREPVQFAVEITNVPKNVTVDEEGNSDLDLSQMQSKDALAYMVHSGLMPPMFS